jgi:hypothetical protein
MFSGGALPAWLRTRRSAGPRSFDNEREMTPIAVLAFGGLGLVALIVAVIAFAASAFA